MIDEIGIDYDDFEPLRELSEDDFKCDNCGHIGNVWETLAEEIQGDGVMTGLVYIATGDMECPICGSEEISDLDGNLT